jgi:hypothetical protein
MYFPVWSFQYLFEGVGTTTKQAEPIGEESENMLWNKGLLGDSSSNSILNTVFFYNSKLFGLRRVDEHRELCVNQISIGTDQTGKYIIGAEGEGGKNAFCSTDAGLSTNFKITGKVHLQTLSSVVRQNT